MSQFMTLINDQKDQFLSVVSDPTIEFAREAQFAMQIIEQNTYLQGICRQNPQSLKNAIVNVAAIGISLNPASKLAYLVPRDGKVCLDLSYMGLMHLAQQCGAILWGQAQLVREGDIFELHGVGREPTHKYNPFSKERNLQPVVGVYSVVKTDSGDFLTECMSIEEVHSIRDRSAAWKAWLSKKAKCPWVTDEGEMTKKGLALDTVIPTPTGWTTMGEIDIGDSVFDQDGNVVYVVDVSDEKLIQCFRVTFSNGESIICDDEHRWVARYGKSHANRKKFSVMTINEMHAAKLSGQSVTVPVQGALDLPDAVLPIDPYLFGYWLGDGTARRPQITCCEADLAHVKSSVIAAGYQVGAVTKDKRGDAYSVGVVKGLLEDLGIAGVISNKHVPKIYMRASIDQRKALLAGLLDSDGCMEKSRGFAMFCSTNELLSKAVYELASSLGEVPNIHKRIARGYGVETTVYNVQWKPTFCCFTLGRKAANYKPRKIQPYRSIKSIEVVDSVPTKCIAVTGTSSTYLAGNSMIPTHNTVLKRAAKMWPRRDRLDKAIHHLNTDGNEGLAQEKDITPITEDQITVINDGLEEMGKTFADLAKALSTVFKRTINIIDDLSQEEGAKAISIVKTQLDKVRMAA